MRKTKDYFKKQSYSGSIKVEEWETSGVVSNIKRGEESTLELVVMRDTKGIEKRSNDTIKLPVKVKSNVEIIPYEMALLNQQIKYTMTLTSTMDSLYHLFGTREHKLEVLSGHLNGKIYKDSENNI